jgi:hypothetical protein
VEKKPLNIYQRIHAVMKDVDYIKKGDKKVNGQYNFVSHDQVSAKLHPYLVKHGIVVIPSVDHIHQEGNRTEVKIGVVFKNIDDPADCFITQYPGYGIDSGDKGPGKAISYAFKYALLKVFCLETGDDPDNDANTSYEPEKCQEFESALPGDIDMDVVEEFLRESAEASQKHIEDMKRDAVKRMDQFLKAFEKWKKRKSS